MHRNIQYEVGNLSVGGWKVRGDVLRVSTSVECAMRHVIEWKELRIWYNIGKVKIGEED